MPKEALRENLRKLHEELASSPTELDEETQALLRGVADDIEQVLGEESVEPRSVRDRLEQAALAFREARRQPDELPAWQLSYADAVGHLAEDRFDDCLAVCDEILAVDPDAADVWRLRGDALRFREKMHFAN